MTTVGFPDEFPEWDDATRRAIENATQSIRRLSDSYTLKHHDFLEQQKKLIERIAHQTSFKMTRYSPPDYSLMVKRQAALASSQNLETIAAAANRVASNLRVLESRPAMVNELSDAVRRSYDVDTASFDFNSIVNASLKYLDEDILEAISDTREAVADVKVDDTDFETLPPLADLLSRDSLLAAVLALNVAVAFVLLVQAEDPASVYLGAVTGLFDSSVAFVLKVRKLLRERDE